MRRVEVTDAQSLERDALNHIRKAYKHLGLAERKLAAAWHAGAVGNVDARRSTIEKMRRELTILGSAMKREVKS